MSWGRAAREQREAQQRHAELMARLAATGQPDPKPIIPDWLPAVCGGARRAAWRHRRMLAPFTVLAVVAAAGAVVAARQTPPAATAVLAALVGAVWWRARSGRLDRAAERHYAATCLAAPAVWLTWAAAAGPWWLALTAGWTVLAAPWWRHHRPRPRIDAPDAAPLGDPTVALWNENLGDAGRRFAGATLHHPTPFEHGTEYRLSVVPGRHTIAAVNSELEIVGSGLRTPRTRLVIEQHPEFDDPTEGRLRRVDVSPVQDTQWFDRPRWDDQGRILIGPHADGMGEAAWRLYVRNGMYGGAMFGSQGIGKTRLLELLAVTVRAMSAAGWPTVIVYVDGQNGASSPLLWRHATIRAGADEAGEVLAAVREAMRLRQHWNRVHGLSGFTPGASPDGGATPGIPGLLCIVDECHLIWPDTGSALSWSSISREGRKVGTAAWAADQHCGLDVFGGQEVLRSTLYAGNGIGMYTASNISGSLVPGMDVHPSKIPAIPGYGYKIVSPGQEGRAAPFRARYMPDDTDLEEDPGIPVPTVEQWFERTADAPLDEMTARAFGSLHTDRDAREAAAREAALAEIEGRSPERERVVITKPAAKDSTLDVIERMLLAGPQKRGDILRHVCAATGVSESAVRSALGAGKVRGRLEALTTAPDGSSGHGWYGLTRAKETVG